MRLAFDIEGNGLSEVVSGNKGQYLSEADKVWCLSISDIDTGNKELFTGVNIAIGVSKLEEASLIVGHNIYGYDLPMLQRLYKMKSKVPFREVIDTLLISRIMYPDGTPFDSRGSHSLAAWGNFLKEVKTEYSGGWEAYTAEMGSYCLQDSVVSLKIFNYMQKFIKQNDKALYLEHTVSSIIQRQIEIGIGFDRAEAKILSRELKDKQEDIENQLRDVFPPIVENRGYGKRGQKLKDKVILFNPGSRQQIASRLFQTHNIEVPRTEKGNPMVTAEVLSGLDNIPECRVLNSYFRMQKMSSQVDDWISRTLVSRDRRIHGSVNTLGTVTGRMTAKEPNLQQVDSEPKMRKLFIPSPGRVLVGCDLKGLELRMLAHYLYPRDGGAYAKVVLNGDVHEYNKEMMGADSRNTAKVAIYGFIYGSGDAKFAKIMNVSIYKARQIKENMLKNIKGLRELVEETKNLSGVYGEIKPFNLRPIPIRKDYIALNTLLQSSGALIAKAWLCIADARLKKDIGIDNYAWLLNVHDEVQLECSQENSLLVAKVVTEAATAAGVYLNCNVRIDADFKIGNNWSETH